MENSSFLDEKGCKLYTGACKNMMLNYAVRTNVTEVLRKKTKLLIITMATLERGALLIFAMKASFEMPLQHKSKVCEMCYRGCKWELHSSHSHRCPTLSCDEIFYFFSHWC